MYELIEELIEVIREINNPINIWVNIVIAISSFLSVIVALSIAIVSIKLNRKALNEARKSYEINKDMLITSKKDYAISNQEYYPIVEMKNIRDSSEERICSNRIINKEYILLSEIEAGDNYVHLMLDIRKNGIELSNYYKVLYFELENVSKAIINSIRIINISLPFPESISNNSLSYKGKNINIDYDIGNKATLFKNDSSKYVLQMFLDSADYYNYYSIEHLSFSISFKITTITNFVSYQTVVFDTINDIRYIINEDEDEVIFTLESGSIYINNKNHNDGDSITVQQNSKFSI